VLQPCSIYIRGENTEHLRFGGPPVSERPRDEDRALHNLLPRGHGCGALPRAPRGRTENPMPISCTERRPRERQINVCAKGLENIRPEPLRERRNGCHAWQREHPPAAGDNRRGGGYV